MSNEVTIRQKNDVSTKKDINTEHDLSIIEQVVMQGDLSRLTPVQRVTYYHKVCESIGLNPYTRPFDYISLNGKLTLYAKKDATEQLRQVKKISIIELEGKLVDDLYIVVAKARTADGRLDQATGAVNLGKLQGEQKANAIMKAETKAKRRVTLSIAGMGWTDQSEIESIPNASLVNVDIETGEIMECKADLHEPIQYITDEDARVLENVLQGDEEYAQKVLEFYKAMSFQSIERKHFGLIHSRARAHMAKKAKPAEIPMAEASVFEAQE